MEKSKPRDFFRYPMSELDLVQFVIKSEKSPPEIQPLFTEEEFNQTLQRIQYEEIIHLIRRDKQCQKLLGDFVSIDKQIQTLLYQTYMETINQVYTRILLLLEREKPLQEEET